MIRLVGAALALGAVLAWTSPESVAVAAEDDSLDAIRKDWLDAYNKGRGRIKPNRLIEICDRAFAVAIEDEDQKAAALMMVIQYSTRSPDKELVETTDDAIEMMIDSFVDEPQIVDLVLMLGQDNGPHAKKYGAYLDEIAEETGDERIAAAAGYARLQPLLMKEKYEGGLSKAEKKRLIAGLEAAAAKLGDLEDTYGRIIKAMAEGAVFEMTSLQVGCEAPEISGEDIDGVAFKLSDYRGKVILLDFWGHW